jgi:hypothetical protein
LTVAVGPCQCGVRRSIRAVLERGDAVVEVVALFSSMSLRLGAALPPRPAERPPRCGLR